MNKKKPLVSIGMAIYNEELFLRKTINSLLKQTYSNFEIIISDNASTDKTEKICKSFLKKDKRIKYFRNKENMGAIYNFNRVKELAKGKYFMWASGHDLWNKTYIEKCINELEKDTNIVLCHTLAKDISFHGKVILKAKSMLEATSSSPYERVKKSIFFLTCWVSYAFYGIFRSSIQENIQPVKDTYGSDLCYILKLSYYGKIKLINQYLYYSRKNRLNEKPYVSNSFKRFSSPKKKHFLYLTETRLFFSFLSIINSLPLNFFEKIKLNLYTIKMFLTKRIRRFLFGEVLRIIIGEKNLYKIRMIKYNHFNKK